MNDKARLMGLVLLLSVGITLAVVFSVTRVDTPLPSSLAPVFQLLGTPVKAVDHLVTRVIPVNDVDEREFGDVLRARYDAQTDTTDQDSRYLNDLMTRLATAADKPFSYKVYLLDYDRPNAMALPGGVVLVNRGFLDVLQSEAELVAVLAHELGHIEQGHCVDAVKFRLLADKLGDPTFGQIVDFAVRMLVSHSFSKTQEDEADEYAYSALVNSPYDPRGIGGSFASLLRYATRSESVEPRGADPIRDYFRSHPPLQIREARFRERAEAWWRRNGDQVRHVGEENLRRRAVYVE
jgi:predicted Zn-dependent protease